MQLKLVLVFLFSILSLSASCCFNDKVASDTIQIVECDGSDGLGCNVAGEFEKKYVCIEIAMHRLLLLACMMMYLDEQDRLSYFDLDLYSSDVVTEIEECLSVLNSHVIDDATMDRWEDFSVGTLHVMGKRNRSMLFIISMLICQSYVSPDRNLSCKLQNFFIKYSGESWESMLQKIREREHPSGPKSSIDLRSFAHQGCYCCDGMFPDKVRIDELSVFVRFSALKTMASAQVHESSAGKWSVLESKSTPDWAGCAFADELLLLHNWYLSGEIEVCKSHSGALQVPLDDDLAKMVFYIHEASILEGLPLELIADLESGIGRYAGTPWEQIVDIVNRRALGE